MKFLSEVSTGSTPYLAIAKYGVEEFDFAVDAAKRAIEIRADWGWTKRFLLPTAVQEVILCHLNPVPQKNFSNEQKPKIVTETIRKYFLTEKMDNHIEDVRYTYEDDPKEFGLLETGELFVPYPSDPIIYTKHSARYAFKIDGTIEQFVFNNTEIVYPVSSSKI